jgi:hypothetical protein
MKKVWRNFFQRVDTAVQFRHPGDKSSASVIFTTSGVASPTLPIIPANSDRPTLSVFQHRLLIHTSITKGNTNSSAFRAYFRGRNVVVKMAEDHLMHHLEREAEMYHKMIDMQGDIIPRLYGLFFLRETCALLVLEDCGKSIKSFANLTRAQR